MIDIAKLDENMQGYVFGDVMRAIYDLKLGKLDDEREENDIPDKISSERFIRKFKTKN